MVSMEEISSHYKVLKQATIYTPAAMFMFSANTMTINGIHW